jgi:hypothetical protein
MKKLVLIACVVGEFVGSCFADIGQSRKEIERKYNAPIVTDWPHPGDKQGSFGSNSATYQFHNWSISIRYNSKGLVDRASYYLRGYREMADHDLRWILENNGVAAEMAETMKLTDFQLVGDDGDVLQDSDCHEIKGSLFSRYGSFLYLKVHWCTGTYDDTEAPILRGHGHGADVVYRVELWSPKGEEEFNQISENNLRANIGLRYHNDFVKWTKNPNSNPPDFGKMLKEVKDRIEAWNKASKEGRDPVAEELDQLTGGEFSKKPDAAKDRLLTKSGKEFFFAEEGAVYASTGKPVPESDMTDEIKREAAEPK